MEKDVEKIFDEIVNYKDFQKSDTEIEEYESIEKLTYPQEYDDGCIVILDDLNEKQMNDPRVQAMFKRSRHNNLPNFFIGQHHYEVPKRTIRANGNLYHIFKPNNFLDVRNIYQDETPMDMSLNEIKYSISTCWNENYQILTFDMTKGKNTGRYRLGLNSIFVPNTSPFGILK